MAKLTPFLGDFTIDEGGRVRSGIGATIDASAFVRQPLTDQLLIIGQVAARATRYRKSEFNWTPLQGRIGAQFRVGSRRLSLALTQQRQI